MINNHTNNKAISFCYLFFCLVLSAFSRAESGTEPVDTMKAEFHEVVSSLIVEGASQGISDKGIPKWVWQNLGEALNTADIKFSSLFFKLDEESYQRELIFRSEDYSEISHKTVPFAVVAIILSAGQETVTHDHDVECGPLLVDGEVTERYGYSDQLVSAGTNIAILDQDRKLQKFQTAQYLYPDQDNTHRLKEASGNQPAITLNLYVDSQGNSVKHKFPNCLGIDGRSGGEWWSE